MGKFCRCLILKFFARLNFLDYAKIRKIKFHKQFVPLRVVLDTKLSLDSLIRGLIKKERLMKEGMKNKNCLQNPQDA